MIFGYITSCNYETKCPNWVAWHLIKERTGGPFPRKGVPLLITDDDKALAFLENVSYFRFRTYLRPMEQDTVTHQYKPGASFGKAVSLYQFDARLRMLVFSAIQQIEVSLRAKVINLFIDQIHIPISHR